MSLANARTSRLLPSKSAKYAYFGALCPGQARAGGTGPVGPAKTGPLSRVARTR